MRRLLFLAIAAPGLAFAGAAAAQSGDTPPPPIALPITPVAPLEVPLVTNPPMMMAPPAPPRPSIITNPMWQRMPQPRYPDTAKPWGISQALVYFQCTAKASGHLEDCVVTSESHPGYGFLEAALASIPDARMSPRTIDGENADSAVAFRVRFMLD